MHAQKNFENEPSGNYMGDELFINGTFSVDLHRTPSRLAEGVTHMPCTHVVIAHAERRDLRTVCHGAIGGVDLVVVHFGTRLGVGALAVIRRIHTAAELDDAVVVELVGMSLCRQGCQPHCAHVMALFTYGILNHTH